MARNVTHLSALSRLFSSSVFREMAKKGRSPLFARLIDHTDISNRLTSNADVGDAFNAAFADLRKPGARDEYVYRAALTHNLLLGRHSLKTASILTEFRAGSCIADLAIVNGTATVYEIKSDRDTLARLPNQIANYRRVFAKVYVIASSAYVQDIIDITPSDVGVMSLVRWNRIHIEREATERRDLVSPVAILESLRLTEARSILEALNVPIPSVPNTLMHTAMHECFARLSPMDTHDKMVEVLKRSRNMAPLGTLVKQLPSSLQPVALSTRVKRAHHERLIGAVRTPLNDAMAWACS